MADDAAYVELRPLLFAVAYRMLGSVADAEDVVQEAFLRYHRAVYDDGVAVASAKAYLTAVTTRLAIDQLRSARVRRESYIGAWFPEPLVSDPADPAQQVVDADSLSMAFLLVLERLTPVERAVFLLHDVFGYPFTDIASFLERTPGDCRQIAVRARRHVTAHAPRLTPSRAERDELAARFLAALQDGDTAGLVSVLAADVVAQGDGGGHRPSWPKPIIGRDKVVRMFLALSEQARAARWRIDAVEVNGQPGARVSTATGELINILAFDIAEGQLRTIRSVINAEKLGHLGPIADRDQLLAALRSARD